MTEKISYERYKDFSKQSWCRIVLIQVILLEDNFLSYVDLPSQGHDQHNQASTDTPLQTKSSDQQAFPDQDNLINEDQEILLEHIASDGLVVNDASDISDENQDEFVHIIDKEFLYYLWDLYKKRPRNLIEHISIVAKMKTHWSEVDHFVISLLVIAYLEMKNLNPDQRISIIKPYVLIYEYYNDGDQQAFIFHSLNAIKDFWNAQKISVN